MGTNSVSEEQALFLDTLYFNKNIKEFIRYREYDLSLKNESIFSEYHFTTRPKVNDLRKIDFSLIYSRTDNRAYKDITHLIIIGDAKSPENFSLIKEYSILRVYKK